jgi:hypothetical protein
MECFTKPYKTYGCTLQLCSWWWVQIANIVKKQIKNIVYMVHPVGLELNIYVTKMYGTTNIKSCSRCWEWPSRSRLVWHLVNRVLKMVWRCFLQIFDIVCFMISVKFVLTDVSNMASQQVALGHKGRLVFGPPKCYVMHPLNYLLYQLLHLLLIIQTVKKLCRNFPTTVLYGL